MKVKLKLKTSNLLKALKTTLNSRSGVFLFVKFQLSGKQFKEHLKVGDQCKQGIRKTGRFILFKNVMTEG